jgi:hypothetical protein
MALVCEAIEAFGVNLPYCPSYSVENRNASCVLASFVKALVKLQSVITSRRPSTRL